MFCETTEEFANATETTLDAEEEETRYDEIVTESPNLKREYY